jgi:Aminoglycoside-2''-adenylyltransferase
MILHEVCGSLRRVEAVLYVRDLLAGLSVPWFLCGGWAADVWLGRQTRPHLDVDIAVLHDDQRAVFEHLRGWALVAHDASVPDDTTQQWDGRRLDPPAHIHVPTLASPLATSTTLAHPTYEFEFLLSERSGTELMSLTWQSPWGLRVFCPELVLFHKAGGKPRRQDEEDFARLLPALDQTQRRWLREAIAEVHPDDPWLARLPD